MSRVLLSILVVLALGALALIAWRGLGAPSEAGPGRALAPTAGSLGPAAERTAPAAQRAALPAAGGPLRGSAEAPPLRSVAQATEQGHSVILDVRDAVTGAPVTAFVVGSPALETPIQGRAGHAELHGLPAGAVQLELRGPEHPGAEVTVALPRADPLIVRLEQATGLRGDVRTSDGRPAPDVVVRMLPLNTASNAAPGPAPAAAGPRNPVQREVASPTMAKTDSEGHYRFVPLAPGHYRGSVEHLGQLVAELGPVEVVVGLTELPVVRLELGARLELEVYDAEGRPRIEALIVVTLQNGATLRRYSDREGKLTLDPLKPGRATITVPTQSGLPEQRRELELTLGLHRETFRSVSYR